MRIRFTLGEEDYLTYANYHYAHTTAGRAGMIRMYIIGIILFVLFAYSQMDDATYGVQNPLFYGSYLAVSAMILGGLYYAYIQMIRPGIIRWASQKTDIRDILGEQEICWDSEKVEVVKEGGKGSVAWRDVKCVELDKQHFYIVLAPLRAFIVPHGAFESQEAARTAAQDAKAFFLNARKAGA